jgi:hypothetical protein
MAFGDRGIPGLAGMFGRRMPLFHAAHEVITRLREASGSSPGR